MEHEPIDNSSHGIGMTHSSIADVPGSRSVPGNMAHEDHEYFGTLNVTGVNFTAMTKSETDRWICLLGSADDSEMKFDLTATGARENDTILRNPVYCPRDWDKVLCWPRTPEGFSVTLNCFEEFRGILYDKTKNVSRACEAGGKWQNVTDYASSCPELRTSTAGVGDENTLGIQLQVYFFGYCVSLTALLLAIIIFLAFNCQLSGQTSGGQSQVLNFVEKPSSLLQQQAKELRCLRNKIHTQLMITYTMAAILWIITNFTTSSLKGSVSSQVSCVAFILLHYFHLTSFFWMFVEGLYLYVLVVQTFQTQTENIKLRVYTAIGWGLPLLVVIGWSIVKWQTFRPTASGLPSDIDLELELNSMSCGFINTETYYDWMWKGPAILILFVNVVFLLRIMWVLITKLRSTTNPETKQSRKAAKAFVVLVPLLGITYIFTLAGPRKLPAYVYFRAFLISTQGFLVALFYCFLNGEVKRAVSHRWNRSNCCTSLKNCICCYGRCCWGPDGRRRHLQQVHEWSSRSRNESIRLYAPAHPYNRKRESDGSETTMTSVFGGGSSVGSNGAHPIIVPARTPKLLTLQTQSLLNKESAYNLERRNNYA